MPSAEITKAETPDQGIIAAGRAALLATIEDAEERVDWVIEQIAGENLEPSDAKRWKGRKEIVKKAAEEWEIGEQQAGEIVDLAVAELFSPDRDSKKHVQFRLFIKRINLYCSILMSSIREPKKEMVWAWEKVRVEGKVKTDSEGKPILVKVPKREVVMTGFDPMAFRLLIDLEEMKLRLLKLEETEESADVVAQLTASWDSKTADSDPNGQVSVSVSQRVKKADLKTLNSPMAQDIVKRALRRSQAAKPVESTVVEDDDAAD